MYQGNIRFGPVVPCFPFREPLSPLPLDPVHETSDQPTELRSVGAQSMYVYMHTYMYMYIYIHTHTHIYKTAQTKYKIMMLPRRAATGAESGAESSWDMVGLLLGGDREKCGYA